MPGSAARGKHRLRPPGDTEDTQPTVGCKGARGHCCQDGGSGCCQFNNLGPAPKATDIKTEICLIPMATREQASNKANRGGDGWVAMGKWEEQDPYSGDSDYKETSGNHAHKGREPRGRC